MTIEFFHDVLCAWCYAFSPRVRKLVEEFPEIQVIHRAFPLAPEPISISEMFGSKERGKEEILKHWEAANINDDQHRINTQLMMTKDFDYPYSTPGLLACKAAEKQGGQAMHWDYFDRLQKAHLSECRNIADKEVLLDVARELGLNMEQFEKDMESKETMQALQEDIERAMELGVSATPTLVANGHSLAGAVSYQRLRNWYLSLAT
ncbi:DsbA family oxidoreductase [Coprothermobacter platensis]|uniref:DsbA family oxidoreductase n=1 Tax=Coprothermobacter platensis TaxID=108819 RepID=UPI00036558AE|nr:DsbA family protein [Coprothermobacter platensis]